MLWRWQSKENKQNTFYCLKCFQWIMNHFNADIKRYCKQLTIPLLCQITMAAKFLSICKAFFPIQYHKHLPSPFHHHISTTNNIKGVSKKFIFTPVTTHHVLHLLCHTKPLLMSHNWISDWLLPACQ